MIISSLVYATDSGLGYLAKSFYDAGVVNKALVIKHRHFRSNYQWYPEARVISGFYEKEILEYLTRSDAVLFFETPFFWEIIPLLKRHRIKSIICVMFECEPKILPYQPDYFLCPSLLDQQYYPERSEFIPVPVPDSIPWRLRTEAKVFVHNAGHGGLNNRNGTGELLDAMKYVKNPIKLIIRSQKPLQWDVTHDSRIDYRVGTYPYETLYDEGDVFIFPEKFNGLSLPLQEARASGMVVMCGKRFPMDTWLPNETLIPVDSYKRDSISGRCNEFDSAVISPQAIAQMIDEYYGKNEEEISGYSNSALEFRQQMSWGTLKSRYMKFFEKVLGG